MNAHETKTASTDVANETHRAWRHDCKNVLTSIVLYSNALNQRAKKHGDDEGAELATEIEVLAKKLNDMIEEHPETREATTAQ